MLELVRSQIINFRIDRERAVRAMDGYTRLIDVNDPKRVPPHGRAAHATGGANPS